MTRICTLLLLVGSFAVHAQEDKAKLKQHKYFLKKMEAYSYVPVGAFNVQVDQDTSDIPQFKVEQLGGFYMLKYEVSNINWLEFYTSIQNEYGKDLANQLLPDTMVWREKLAYGEPYVDYYFRHPAYRDYPVVGISKIQAEAYCRWITRLFNEKTPEEDRFFKKVNFRLPTETEWEYAAFGGLQNEHGIFPWGGPYMQNSKGEYLANFLVIPQPCIVGMDGGDLEIRADGMASYLADDAYLTAPVKSYFPNTLGLYNMAGNVAEFVAEDGITKGGSWKDTGYYLRVRSRKPIDKESEITSQNGFRFVMDVVEN